ncbi:hypothetical protein QN345_02240 [Cryobacterium sp. 10I1]|uniref:hypothetical protein n=1 Tax=unclassified Cryobacterium TaxID=2649013 RepID=UPI002AC989A3|nr:MULTISPECIES: hypothetical protein [unclassified Cryobacterium]MEB0003694.1 hypothetical protein [Cryobacterium sp. RTC2.1]MEB0286857.1 hypothetical protein [Cryobacterium sp. 10S3]MEB0304155.1 hypothetical protein [Cryobacterium sp. 10I1]WPX13461.1 hypothetical protein RHM57_17610 [Cryobacterium sp. 10S3]
MSNSEDLCEVRLRRCGAQSRIWEITLFPVIDECYDRANGLRTRMMFSAALPFDEFWFDSADLSTHRIDGQLLPVEVAVGVAEFVAHVRGIVTPCMKPSAEPPAQSF